MTNTRMEDTTMGTDALESRRSLLRRSMFGVAAIGVTGLLAACGNDDEEPASSGGQGAQGEPGQTPGIEEETGIGQGSDGTPEG